MYTNTRNNDRFDVFSYIDGNDLYNSKLIKRIRDKNIDLSTFTINKSSTRSDIISQQVYSNSNYESFIYLLNHDVSDDKLTYNTVNNLDTLLDEAGV